MKGVLFTALCTMLFVSGLFSQSEIEPNNTFATATAVPLNFIFYEKIDGKKDVDFFKIKLPKDGVIEVYMDSIPCTDGFCRSGVPLSITVYKSDANTVVESFSNNGNKRFSTNFPVLLEKGSYFIRISAQDTNYFSSQPFRTAFNFDTGDVNEANNQVSKAKLVPLNTLFKEKIYGYNLTAPYTKNGNTTGQDVDFFKIITPRDGVVEVHMDSIPCIDAFCRSGMPLQIKVLASDGVTVVSNFTNNGQQGFSTDYPVLLEKGSYFIQVSTQGFAYSSAQSFRTNFKFDTSDLSEANNQLSRAKLVSLNTLFKEKIYGYNLTAPYTKNGNTTGQDVDFFKITTSQDGIVEEYIDSIPCIDAICRGGIPLLVKVLASNGITVIDSFVSGGFSVRHPVSLKKGDYFIQINTQGFAYSSSAYFKTAFNFSATPPVPFSSSAFYTDNIQNIPKKSLFVSPNPVQTTLFVNIENDKTENAILQLLDVQGKIMKQQNLKLIKGKTFVSVNTSALSKGTYVLVLRASTLQKQIIVKE